MALTIALGLAAAIVVLALLPALGRRRYDHRAASGDLPAGRGYARRRSRTRRGARVRDAARRAFGQRARGRDPASSADPPKTCPVCRADLARGERIKSVVFSGGVQHRDITEFTTHIFGCPHCYPANHRHPRICPVCRGEVDRDGHLIARMFEKRNGKKHVRVLGCTACRENRRARR